MDVWTVIAALAGMVAAVAALAAVWYARRALTQAERSQRIADDRYQRDIVPRPRLTGMRGAGPAGEYFGDVVNAGGAAVLCLVLVQRLNEIMAGGGALPSHGTVVMRLSYRRTIDDVAAEPRAVLIAARDVQLVWWDCMLSVPIENLAEWWTAQLNDLHIPIIPLEMGPDATPLRIGV